MGLQISWRKLHGDALCSTQMVQKYFVCMIHVQWEENLASRFYLGIFTTVTLSSTILPGLFSCILKGQ